MSLQMKLLWLNQHFREAEIRQNWIDQPCDRVTPGWPGESDRQAAVNDIHCATYLILLTKPACQQKLQEWIKLSKYDGARTEPDRGPLSSIKTIARLFQSFH